MIELVPSESDDIAFLELAQRILNGAVTALRVREVYLVHVDNWFDYKWLGWWSWGEKEGRELRVPPFIPKRVHSEKRFIWDEPSAQWTSANLKKPLHRYQPELLPVFWST